MLPFCNQQSRVKQVNRTQFFYRTQPFLTEKVDTKLGLACIYIPFSIITAQLRKQYTNSNSIWEYVAEHCRDKKRDSVNPRGAIRMKWGGNCYIINCLLN